MNNDIYMRHEPVLKKVKLITLIISAISLVLGIALIMFPEPMQEIMGFITGVAAIAVGAHRLYIYFRRQREATILATDLFLGIVCVIAGLIFIIRRSDVSGYVVIIYGVLLVAGGIVKLQNSIDLYHIGLYRWWIVLILGCASMFCGVLLILKPQLIVPILITIAGLFLIYDGISGFFTVIFFDLTLKKVKKGIPIGRPAPKPQAAPASGAAPVPPQPGTAVPPQAPPEAAVHPEAGPGTEDPFDPAVIQSGTDFGGTAPGAAPQAHHMNFDPDTGEPLGGNK